MPPTSDQNRLWRRSARGLAHGKQHVTFPAQRPRDLPFVCVCVMRRCAAELPVEFRQVIDLYEICTVPHYKGCQRVQTCTGKFVGSPRTRAPRLTCPTSAGLSAHALGAAESVRAWSFVWHLDRVSRHRFVAICANCGV